VLTAGAEIEATAVRWVKRRQRRGLGGEAGTRELDVSVTVVDRPVRRQQSGVGDVQPGVVTDRQRGRVEACDRLRLLVSRALERSVQVTLLR
jgi:hypothetical protein